ncbi:hypothetical protein GALMADRAFT_720426 [Galerina marginata CBS 339.88]|uniref:Uncharacterized protein n=1 Tax=Galerina marginata (strain CBS 339.88) TaxID=685588 RepID=A0A067TXF2_GALM3|nr:hypothetical protein GALMADRAFT_720426 [Galerina marginata CBS 339.88]
MWGSRFEWTTVWIPVAIRKGYPVHEASLGGPKSWEPAALPWCLSRAGGKANNGQQRRLENWKTFRSNIGERGREKPTNCKPYSPASLLLLLIVILVK